MSKLVRRLSSCLLFLTLTLLTLTTGRPAAAADPIVLASGGVSGISVNSLGEAVWSQWDQVTGFSQLYSSQRGQLTFDASFHDWPSINNRGDLAWISQMKVMARIDGRLVVIHESSAPNIYRTDINDRGEVVWSEDDFTGPRGVSYLFSSVRGQLTSGTTKMSMKPSINNRGDVLYKQWDLEPATEAYSIQMYKLPAGSTTPVAVTSRMANYYPGGINDAGEAVWGETDTDNPAAPDLVVSDRRGVLAQLPNSTIQEADINNCGDVIYAAFSPERSQLELYRLGNAAPCASISGNNSREQAATVAYGEVSVGVAEAAAPENWYRFDATVGDVIKVAVNYDARTPNLDIGLYDADGNLLSGPTSPLPLTIRIRAAYSGSYYLKVTGQGGQRVGYAVTVTSPMNCGSGPCPELVAEGNLKSGVSLNSLGEALWVEANPASGYDAVISSRRGEIMNLPGYYSSPAINALGDTAWVVDNIAANPSSPLYTLWATVNGTTFIVYSGEKAIDKVDINDRREIVWSQYEGPGFGIYSTRRGRLTGGTKPSINNAGDVFYLAPDAAGRNQVYEIAAEMTEPLALTADGLDHRAVAATDGETVWAEVDPATSTSRIFSSSRGVLLGGVQAAALDLNRCGDLIFSAPSGQGFAIYRLGAASPCASYAENHATQAEAAALNSGDILSGTVSAGTPVTWYRFEATAKEKVYLTVNWDNRPPNELKFTIYAPDWSGETWFEPGVQDQIYPNVSGTYYLKVEGSGGSFGYTLSFSRSSENCGSGVCPDRVVRDPLTWGVAINSLGEIAYNRFANGKTQVFTTLRGQVTDDGQDHMHVALNNLGDLVWTTYDLTASPQRYILQGLIQGKLVTLASGSSTFYAPDINDSGEVVWSQIEKGQTGVYSNRRGRLATGWNATINNSGDVAFTRNDGTEQVFKLAAGATEPVQVTNGNDNAVALAFSDHELVTAMEDKAQTRVWFTSSQRGRLLSTVSAWDLDVNNCGDVAYLQADPVTGGLALFRLGTGAPCLSYPGIHDSRETAAVLAPEGTFIGATSWASPVSWYRFDAGVAQTLEIRAYYPDTQVTNLLQVSVYDEQGNLLSGPFPRGMEFTAPATGSYYLKVQGTRMGDGIGFGYSIAMRAKAPQLLKWLAEGEPEWYYASLQESLFHLPAAPELKLLLRDGELSENLRVNVCEKTVRLSGGYDALFATVFGQTRLSGAVRVSCGKLVADGIVIR